MKLRTQERDLTTMGVQGHTEFSVKLDAHLMELLSGLYEQIRWAVVREYWTNAEDGVTLLAAQDPQAKIPPIEIHVPNRLEPYWSVRDYGVGMDHDTVWSVYTQYGNSTKNQANIEAGGFGIGAKAAFCYEGADQWTITSIFDGMKRIYIATRNDRGMPTLTLMAESPTTEATGVMIQVPVATKDIDEFVKSTRRFARRATHPFIILGDKTGVSAGEYEPIKYTQRSKDYGWRPHGSGEHGVFAVMGSVPYKVDLRAPDLNLSSAEISYLDKQGSVDLFFDIGDLDIVPSREGLKYTKHTVAKLVDKFPALVQDTVKTFLKGLAACGNQVDAWKYLNERRSERTLAESRIGGKHILSWNGIPASDLSRKRFTVDEIVAAHPASARPDDLEIHVYSKRFGQVDRTQVLYTSTADQAHPTMPNVTDFTVSLDELDRNATAIEIYVDDMDKRSISAFKRYIKDGYFYRTTQFFLVRGTNVSQKAVARALQGIPVHSLEDKCGHLIQTGAPLGPRSHASLRYYTGYSWDRTEFDLSKGGTYIKLCDGELDAAEFPKWFKGSVSDAKKLLILLKDLGVFTSSKNVMGIPKTRWKKIEKLPNWNNFWDEYEDDIRKWMKKPIPQKPLTADTVLHELDQLHMLQVSQRVKAVSSLPTTSPFRKFAEETARVATDSKSVAAQLKEYTQIAALRQLVQGDMTGPVLKNAPGVDISLLKGYNAWLLERYPVIAAWVTNVWNYRSHLAGVADAFLGYIALVDDNTPVVNEPPLK